MNERKPSNQPAPEATPRVPMISNANAARCILNFHVIPSIPLGFSNFALTWF
jgi:hypothetical protein